MQSFLKASNLTVNADLLKDNFTNVKEFETRFWNAIYNKQEICEIMRFTIGSQNFMHPFDFFCKVFEEMITLCYLQKKFQLTFWVAEEFPVYLAGKSAEEIANIRSSLLTSFYNIEKKNIKACKGLAININLAKSLKKATHKKILKRIKQIRSK